MSNHLLAQNLMISGQPIQGPLKNINNFGDLISRGLEFLMPFALAVLFAVFLASGFDFLSSEGAPEKIKSGKAKFTTGVIGFVALLLTYVVVKFASVIFGFGQGLF